MKIIGLKRSRSTRAVWAAEEAGLDYELQHLQNTQLNDPEFRALNPTGKVPVLVHDELVLTESAAICTWIGQQAPDKGLVPAAGSADFALYLQWCFFVLSELEQPLWSKAKHRFVLPKELRIREITPALEFEWAKFTARLEQGLEGREFLVGQSFTMSDLLAAHTLLWGKGVMGDLSPRLNAWLVAQLSRPALARAMAREAAAGGR